MTLQKAYCPASITLIFKVHPDGDPFKMGSTGIGFTIDKGVIALVKKSKHTTIEFNGNKINFPTVLWAINKLTNQSVSVKLDSPLPLGFGFGLSGASTLASIHALNKLLKLNKTNRQLLQIAYQAEVTNKTGLGTVTTQNIGGFLFKTTPGLQPEFIRLPFINKKIYAVIISKIETPEILKSNTKIDAINAVFDKYLSTVTDFRSKTLEFFFDLGYSFANEAKLIRQAKTRRLIHELQKKGIPATITMLGNVVLTTVKPKLDIRYKILELKISDTRI